MAEAATDELESMSAIISFSFNVNEIIDNGGDDDNGGGEAITIRHHCQ